MLTPPPLSLYIHVPWCVRKCPYCDFNSHQQKGELPIAEYVAALTADLVAGFRSAMERAGLRLETDLPPIGTPVHVDRDMWEKIVLNLLSNAFKFTLAGAITVRLAASPTEVVLTVTDTGVGVPPEELPRLFERFHRVAGQQSRSFEGSGIGLALVQELVRLHGGTIALEPSEIGAVFTVSLPAQRVAA